MAAIDAAAALSEGQVARIPPLPTDDEWSKSPESLPHDKIACLPVTVAVFSIVVSLAAVGLRLYTRHRLLSNLGLDDVCAVLAMFGVIALAVAIFIQADYGLGTHAWDIKDWPHITKYSELLYTQIVIYSTSLVFIKLSISWQYYRIVKHDSRYRIPCIAIICVVVGWSFASTFAMAFICDPIEEFWLVSPLSDKCDFPLGWTVAVGNIVTDFILVLVPMPMVFRLNIKTPEKLSLLGLFAIGFFACIVSVLRLINLPVDADVTYSGAHAAAWTQAEVAACILGSSAMTLQPLLKHWCGKFGLAKRFCRRPSKDGDEEAIYEPTLQERLDSRSNDDISKLPSKPPQIPLWEGSETELMGIEDADETDTMRRVESQSRTSSTQTSPMFSPFGPHSPGGGVEWRHSRHDLDPRGLAVLARTQCRAGPGEDDTPPATATADEGRETAGQRSGPLGIQIKRAWSVQEHRNDEGQQAHIHTAIIGQGPLSEEAQGVSESGKRPPY